MFYTPECLADGNQHLDEGEDARALLNTVTCTVAVLYSENEINH